VNSRRERWRVRLTCAAAADFDQILHWAAGRFGAAQARAYAETLSAAIAALTEGPRVAGARARDDITRGLFALHVARGGRKGRHVVLFRVGLPAKPPTIDILRLLHDAMDLPRHVEPDEDGR
jgi:toxin ParE1/3/4